MCNFFNDFNRTFVDDGAPGDENVTIYVSPSSPSTFQQRYESMRYYVNRVVIPAILCFGVVGNLLNLVLFTHRFLRKRKPGALERAAYAGLFALAASDLSFCLVGIPDALLPRPTHGPAAGYQARFSYHYGIYVDALKNLFIFTSSWIIVVISAERFIAVCYPIVARWYLKLRNGIIVYVLIAIVGVFTTLPLFMKYRIVESDCFSGGCKCTRVEPSALFLDSRFKRAYYIIFSVVGTFLPLLLLVATNVALVVVLFKSRAQGLSNRDRYGCTRVTATVVAIVFSFLLLVCPSMILHSLELMLAISKYNPVSFFIAQNTTNLTQAVKFSSNFVLYCSFMRQYRRGLWYLTTCKRETSSTRLESVRVSYRTTHL